MIVFILLTSLNHAYWQRFPLSKEKAVWTLFIIILSPQTSPASIKKYKYIQHLPSRSFEQVSLLYILHFHSCILLQHKKPSLLHLLLTLMSYSYFPFWAKILKEQNKAPNTPLHLLAPGEGQPPCLPVHWCTAPGTSQGFTWHRARQRGATGPYAATIFLVSWG